MRIRSLIALLLILALGMSLPFAAGATEPLTPQVKRQTALYSYVGGPFGGMTATQTEAMRVKITDALLVWNSDVDLYSFRIPYTQENVNRVVETIFYEIPEGFHVLTASVYPNNGRVGRVVFQLVRGWNKTNYQDTIQRLSNVAESMTDDLKGLGEVEKALLLHDRLALHCEYAYDELLDNTVYDHDEFFNMIGPLLDGRGVCQGYAMAYTYLLRKVGVKARYCMSEQMNHAWNIVTVGGKEYHVDVTHDDPVWDVSGYVSHVNFLRSSAGLYADGHKATDYDTTPTDTTYDEYFWQDCDTAFQLVDGEIYYRTPQRNYGEKVYIKRYSDHSTLLELANEWDNGWGNWSKLDSDGTYILFSTPTAIKRVDPTTGWVSTAKTFTPPQNGYHIYGFTLEDDTLVVDFYSSAYFDGDTKRLYQQRVPYEEPLTVTDITLLLRHLMNRTLPVDREWLDLNKDGALTIADGVLIARTLAA